MDQEMGSREENRAFRDYDVLTAKEDYMGIPTKLFVSIVSLSVIVGFASKSLPVFLIMILGMGIPAYRSHQKDPQAWHILLRVLTRASDRWCAGQKNNNKRKLIVLKKGALK